MSTHRAALLVTATLVCIVSPTRACDSLVTESTSQNYRPEDDATRWGRALMHELRELHARDEKMPQQPWAEETPPAAASLPDIAPEFVSAPWHGLYLATKGLGLCRQEKFEEAIRYLEQAVMFLLDSRTLKIELAMAYNATGQEEAACRIYEELIGMNEGEELATALQRGVTDQDALCNLAYTYTRCGRADDAMACYRSVLTHNPDDERARLGMQFTEIKAGAWQYGWPEMPYEPPSGGRQLACKEDVAGKRVLLDACHGGAGDIFQGVRFGQTLKKLDAQEVILRVPGYLQRIMHGCVGIDKVCTLGDEPPEFDVCAPLLSLPRILELSPDEIPTQPYLHADPVVVDEWREKFTQDGAQKIGVCWLSGTAYHTPHLRAAAKMRTIGPQELKSLQVKGATLYSLKQGTSPEERAALPGVKTPEEKRRGFIDALGIIANMHKVITVDTSIAHLAAASGKEVLLLLPRQADCRWMEDQDGSEWQNRSPWYPTIRIFRQKPGEPDMCNAIKRACEAASR